jgi:mRNA-degrading endonuclease RelE of RelBE toxin-antitoxin system
MRNWRVLYTIDEEHRLVTVRDIRHRRDAYRVQ